MRASIRLSKHNNPAQQAAATYSTAAAIPRQQQRRSNARQPQEDSLVFRQALEAAEYEMNVDPYRGMMMLTEYDGEEDIGNPCPWSSCQWCVQNDNNNNNDNRMMMTQQQQQYCEDPAREKVFRTTHAACPALLQWTRQHDEAERKRRNKRKRKGTNNKHEQQEPVESLGRRPQQVQFACDYNPLCLTSLGGVMDDLLAQAATQVLAQDVEEHSREEGGSPDDSARGKQPEVIDIDASPDSAETQEPAKKRAKSSSPEVEIVENEDNMKVDSRLDPHNKDCIYSSATADEIKQARKTCRVDRKAVQSYIAETILPHATDPSLSMDRYMELLGQWHASLQFSNPLLRNQDENKDAAASTMSLALPPGIQNLGATCYLNTQLQCLARNLCFLDGIFSWRPPASDTTPKNNHAMVMNSVLSTLQLLLARIIHGGQATVTTKDFSEALGLETDEMQDPNEFARLLFARMHEAFDAQQENGNLSNLFPSLFEGSMTYETTCGTCRTTTERREGFMDVNLPIAHSPPSSSSSLEETKPKKSKSGGRQQSIKDAFGGGSSVSADTTVQYCLDQYLCPEELSGENQYWCEGCQQKRDALRAVTLDRLPPVLNVQISRYVYDRTRFVKKKLTDKVLLPLMLMVPKKGDSSSAPAKYLLCSVMRHQGNSAYQGHYLAESMDWQTGTWFEFNDEKVKVLEKGPSCTYRPDDKAEGNNKKPPAGSQDAYNMYYVREDFLAQSASRSLSRISGASCVETSDVIATVANERDSRYSLLREMCQSDGMIANRVSKRRDGILKLLSNVLRDTTTSALCFAPHKFGTRRTRNQAPVWVDSCLLRQFLSCSREDDQKISNSSGPFLRHRHLLCEHKVGLHPRVARRGKLLPRPVYEAFVSILKAEQDEHGSRVHEVNDCIITPECNLYCGDCAASYRNELSRKLEIVKRLKQLREDLDQTAIVFGEGTSSESEDEESVYYYVSKKFISKFRAAVGSILKTIEASDLHLPSAKQLVDGSTSESICEGIDAVDLSRFDCSKGESTSEGTHDAHGDLDELVNSSITCEHGHIGAAGMRTMKCVSEPVWFSLKAIFPRAIAHKRRKQQYPESYKPKHPYGLCPHCRNEEAEKELLEVKLKEWFEQTASAFPSRRVLQRVRAKEDVLSLLVDQRNDVTSPVGAIHLVHRDDMIAWRRAILFAKTKRDCFEIKSQIEDVLFSGGVKIADSDNTSMEDRDTAALPQHRILSSFYGWSPRPLICTEHSLACESALFPLDYDLANDDCNWIGKLASSVELLTNIEYAAYIQSIHSLGALLMASTDVAENNETVDLAGEAQNHTIDEMLDLLSRTHHPKVVGSPLSLVNDATVTSNGAGHPDKSLTVPALCKEYDCNQIFIEESKSKCITGDEGDASPSQTQDVVDMTEMVENTLDDSFSLRIIEIEADKNPEDAVVALLPPTHDDSKEAPAGGISLRRSSRRKKMKYPNGAILGEDWIDVKLCHNLAALRLFLFERIPEVRVDDRLTLVIPSASHPQVDIVDVEKSAPIAAGSEPQKDLFVTLPYAWNEKTLEEVISSATNGKGIELLSLLSKIFICRQKVEDSVALLSNENLLDSLLEIANTSSKSHGSPDGTGKQLQKKRRAERGFRGTFLHSSSTANDDAVEETRDEATKDRETQPDKGKNEETKSASTPDRNSKTDEGESKNEDKQPAEVEDSANVSLLTELSGDDSIILDGAATIEHATTRDGRECSQASGPSSNDTQVVSQPTVPRRSPGLSSTRLLRSDADDPVLDRLVGHLATGNLPTHSRESRQAVRWARDECGAGASIDTIVDSALAKYMHDAGL